MLQLSQRALTASSSDGDLFADRSEELATVERALELGFNVYISGQAGSGKTSFLQRLKARRERTVLLNAARVDTIADLISLTAATVDPSPRINLVGDPFQAIRDQRRQKLENHGADRLGVLRKALAKQSAPRTLLLDNLNSELHQDLFGRQRDELWQVPLQWVAVGDTFALGPPADTFFETSIALEPLTPDAIRELLTLRGRQGDPGQQELMLQIANTLADSLGPANPRRVISTARAVFLSPDPELSLKEIREKQYAHHHLSPTARLVLDALYAVGPTHAGDQRLLDQVGATRSRIVQVLRELEAAELVRFTRAGRRKLYAPALGDTR